METLTLRYILVTDVACTNQVFAVTIKLAHITFCQSLACVKSIYQLAASWVQLGLMTVSSKIIVIISLCSSVAAGSL
jgi:hypothetical protein